MIIIKNNRGGIVMKKLFTDLGNVFVFFFALLLILQLGCARKELEITITTKSDEALQIFLQARAMSENLHTDEARELFSQAIEKDPDFAMAYLYRSFAAASTADRRNDLERAISLAPQVSEGERLLIEANHAYYLENNRQKWAEHFKEMAKKYPEDKRAHYYLGLVYYSYYNDYDKALAENEKAVAIDKDFAPPYNQLGYIYRTKSDYQKAEEAFNNYIRLLPDQPNPYDSMADLLTKMGRYKEAIKNYKKAVELDPRFTTSQRNIGMNLVFMGKYDDGRNAIRKAVDMETTQAGKVASMGAIVRSHLYEGNYQEALVATDKAIQIAADAKLPRREAYYLTEKSYIQIELEEFEQAKQSQTECKKLLEKAEIIPYYKNLYTYFVLWNEAMIATKGQDFETALATADQLKAKIEAVNDPEAMKDWYFPVMGYIHLGKEAYQEAIDYFSKADQESPWTLYYLAVAEYKTGNDEKASELFEKTAHWNEDSFAYAFVRSKAIAALKE